MEPKAPNAHCDQCPLADRPFVGGQGPDDARIAIVGEAPGENEVAQGVPFTGASGKLINKVLAHHGIKREEVYVTNACLCRPEGNATPGARAVKACRDRLVTELRDRPVATILALGAVAAKSILKTTTGITKLRTEPATYSEEFKARIVPTFHPAAALRNPDNFPSIVKDVEKVKNAQHPATIGWEPTRYNVIGSVSDGLKGIAQQVEASKALVLDVEKDYETGDPNDPRGILANGDPKFLCIGVSHRPGAALVYTKEVVDHPQWRQYLNRMFADHSIRWIMQNGKFDIQQLWTAGMPRAHVDEDTMLMHYATDERKGTHDLEQMAVEILSAPRYKTDTRSHLPKGKSSLAHLPPDILYEYNAADCDVTYRLYEKLGPELQSDGVVDLYKNLMIPAANTLAHVEYNGVSVDEVGIARLATKLSGEMEALDDQLQRWVKNPRSPKQVMTVLNELGYIVPNTQKATIKPLGEEFTDTLLDYKAVQKLFGTYVKGMIKRVVRGRIYSNFNQQTTETGRLSSSNPNLQNVPREVEAGLRDLFLAEEDHVLVSADYAAIELRLMTHVIHDRYMTAAFVQGRNLHKEMASAIFGANYTEQQYVWAKNVRFASIYGGSPGYVGFLYNIPEDVVRKLQEEMFRQSPGIKQYWRDIEHQIREQSYLRSMFGRLRRFWLITADNWKDIKKEGYNFPIQSTASDFGLRSLTILEPRLRGIAKPIITLHDSLTFECHKDVWRDVAHEIKVVMEDTGLTVPTPVEFKVGRLWGSHKGPCPFDVCEHSVEVEVA